VSPDRRGGPSFTEPDPLQDTAAVKPLYPDPDGRAAGDSPVTCWRDGRELPRLVRHVVEHQNEEAADRRLRSAVEQAVGLVVDGKVSRTAAGRALVLGGQAAGVAQLDVLDAVRDAFQAGGLR
jgi:hypothetical protein